MNMSAKPDDAAPAPLFSYQGAYLSKVGPGLRLGPFSYDVAGQPSVGHAVAFQMLDAVPVTTVRPGATVATDDGDPADNLIHIGYEQGELAWAMAFSVLTDPAGALVDTEFSLEVHSNYPQIPMSIERTRIQHPGVSFLVEGVLPADYRAQMSLRFWSGGKTNLPLDGWLAVQVAYRKMPPMAGAADTGTPLVTTGELLFFPAAQNDASPMLCNNYPAPDRHKHRANA